MDSNQKEAAMQDTVIVRNAEELRAAIAAGKQNILARPGQNRIASQ